MAVAYDSAATGTRVEPSQVSNPSFTLSVTPTSTTNGILVGLVAWIPAKGNSIEIDNIAVTGMTYNGSAMTAVSGTPFSPQTGVGKIDAYYYIGTISGAHNMVVSWDDLDSPGTAINMTSCTAGVCFTGVHQTTPIAQVAHSSGILSPITTTITTASANNMVVDCAGMFPAVSGITIAVSGSNTQRVNQGAGSLAATTRQGVSTLQATGGSDTMSWTESVSKDWGQCVIELAAAAASAASVSTLMMMGI